MRAVVSAGPRSVRVVDLPDPALEADDDAIVRVTRAGICGSDMHFFHGKAPLSPGDGRVRRKRVDRSSPAR